MQSAKPPAEAATPRSHTWKILLSLAVVFILTGVLVYYKGLSLGEVVAAIGRFGFTAVALVFLCSFAQGIFNIFRIYALFPKTVRPRLGRVAYAISVGQLANTFLPARAGDVIKAVIFGRDPGQPELSVMTGAGVILADKAVDFVAFFSIILLSGAFRLPGLKVPAVPHVPGLGFGLVFLSASFLLVGGWLLRQRLRAFARWIKEFRAGLSGLLQPTGVLIALTMGLGVWASEALALMLLAHYQGFDLSVAQSVFVLCVLNLAIAVPVSVGNVGTFEASVVFGLTTAGVPLPIAVAIAATHHLLQWLAVTTLALLMIGQQRWAKKGMVYGGRHA